MKINWNFIFLFLKYLPNKYGIMLGLYINVNLSADLN